MATTFKAVVLEHHKKKDGTYNVKIRVTHNRQRRYLATNIFVGKEDLTRGLKIKAQNVLDELDKEIERLRKITSTIPSMRAAVMDIADVMEYITGYEQQRKEFKLDFLEFCNDYAQELERTGHTGNAGCYYTLLHSLQQYLDGATLDVNEITGDFVRSYKEWLMTKPMRKGVKERDGGRRIPSKYLATMRALHNRAKDRYNDEGAGIINIPRNPFKGQVPTMPVAEKRAITLEQFHQLQALPYKQVMYRGNNRFNFAKDMFMLSFGLMGMNAADIYECDEYKDGVITYKRKKTRQRRKDEAVMQVKVQPAVQPLFEKYRDRTGKRVFRFYRMYSSVNSFTCAMDKGLKLVGMEINEAKLQYYSAGHTWATLAINVAGLDKLLVHEGLNHVDDTTRVTDVYITKDWCRLHDANSKVLDAVGYNTGSVEEDEYKRKFNHTHRRVKDIMAELEAEEIREYEEGQNKR